MAGSAGFTVLAGPQTYKDTLLELCGGSTQGGLRRARRFWRGPQTNKEKFLELGGGSTQGGLRRAHRSGLGHKPPRASSWN